MSNRTVHGASIRSGSHIAPGARCDNIIQLAGRTPLPVVTRLHGPECKKDHASIYRASNERLVLTPFQSALRQPDSEVSGRRNDLAPFNPAVIFSVGQREDRLSERSPADHSRAAQAGRYHAVQGDRLSHSLSTVDDRSLLTQFAVDLLAVMAFGFLGIVASFGLGFVAFAFL